MIMRLEAGRPADKSPATHLDFEAAHRTHECFLIM
jgi:hypothetical protein